MWSEFGSAIGVILSTILILGGLLIVDPARVARNALIALSGAGTDSAKVEHLFEDWRTQETSNGNDPRPNLNRLTQAWDDCKDRPRVILLGNSQTLSVILAPGEAANSELEKTYPDLVQESYAKGDGAPCIYRLSAPNISYMEVLWYLHYVLAVTELKPTRVVLQLNYETFRKTDIRDGLLNLLDEPRFRTSVLAETQLNQPHSAIFENRVRTHDQQVVQRNELSADQPGSKPVNATTSTGIAESFGFGNALERHFRKGVERLPGSGRRHIAKTNFLDVLYLLRVNVLRITPTTKRSIGGVALDASLSSLERIVTLCKDENIEVVLFNAPQNPAASLYLNEQYKLKYEAMIRQLAASHNLKLFDFENAIPGKYWGVWIDGPDPIHLGREGHRMLAKVMTDSDVFAPH